MNDVIPGGGKTAGVFKAGRGAGAGDNERIQAGDDLSATYARQVTLHLQPARLQSCRCRNVPHSKELDRGQSRHDQVLISLRHSSIAVFAVMC